MLSWLQEGVKLRAVWAHPSCYSIPPTSYTWEWFWDENEHTLQKWTPFCLSLQKEGFSISPCRSSPHCTPAPPPVFSRMQLQDLGAERTAATALITTGPIPEYYTKYQQIVQLIHLSQLFVYFFNRRRERPVDPDNILCVFCI